MTPVFPVAILLALLGLVLGSFAYLLIVRMPREESINGRSKCEECKHMLSYLDLIPLISFLWLGGKCRYCKAKIPFQCPIAEIISAFIFLGAGWVSSFEIAPSILLGVVFWAMATIAVMDAETQMIPDALTVVLGMAALSYQVLMGHPGWTGAVIGLLFFGAQWILSRGLWVGSGDILLAISLGLFLGSWKSMLIALMGAYIIGALLVSVLLGLGKLKRNQHIAFGPFLVAGTLVAFFFSDVIIDVMVPM